MIRMLVHCAAKSSVDLGEDEVVGEKLQIRLECIGQHGRNIQESVRTEAGEIQTGKQQERPPTNKVKP